MINILRVGFLVFAVVSSAAAQTRPAESLVERVGKVALELPWLSESAAYYDQRPWGPDADRVSTLLSELAGDWTPAEVRPLLHSDSPKVRTLAIVLLFRLDRVDVLPDIAGLADDNAATFSEPGRLSNTPPPGTPWPMLDKTVGNYARNVLLTYTRESAQLADITWVASRKDLVDRFQAFAAARDPELSTAGIAMAMNRATTMGRPIPSGRERLIFSVLSRLQRIPMPRRFFVALKVDVNRFYHTEGAPDQLLTMARLVPRDVRLAALEQMSAVDDPDLWPGFGADYFLQHAADLLQTADADLLLKIESKQRAQSIAPQSPNGNGNPNYPVAATVLRPDRADEILIPAIPKFDKPYEESQRMQLAVALARFGSEKGVAAAVDAFFNEKPQPGAYGFGRERFLRQLSESDPARYRKTAALIVRDQRLSTLGPASTRQLLTSAEGFLGRRLASDDEMQESRSIDEFQRDQKFASLSRWQERLRNTVNQWAP